MRARERNDTSTPAHLVREVELELLVHLHLDLALSREFVEDSVYVRTLDSFVKVVKDVHRGIRLVLLATRHGT